MKTADDFQQLLRREHRERLVVLPRLVLNLGVISIVLVSLGFGIGAGSLVRSSELAKWAPGLGLFAALMVGWFIRRAETKALETLKEAD
jgi:hypothetical protein